MNIGKAIGPKNPKMGLNKNQEKAVFHASGPLLVIAGAGSGKTRTLTSRVAQIIKNGAEPQSIVAITFTNKAADEMRRRIFDTHDDNNNDDNKKSGNRYGRGYGGTKGPFIGTFHSFGAKLLRKEAPKLGRTFGFTIFDSDDSLRLIKNIVKKLGISKEERAPYSLQKDISKIKSELCNNIDSFDDLSIKVFKKYEEALKENNAFDFDDLIEKVVSLFRKNPEILKKYQLKYENILVDEFQDVNTAQYEMVRLLAMNHKNLSVVGDDAQSIYSFRNADFRNFLNFEKDWPEATVITLDQNYRSTQTILDAASAVIKNNTVQKQKDLWTEVSGNSPVHIIRAKHQASEAELIADQISLSSDESVAILYRTNAQSRAVETELIVRDIPYHIFGGTKFYERKEIKDLIAGLRIVHNPLDSISRERMLSTFYKRKSQDIVRALLSLDKSQSPLDLINSFIEISGYIEHLKKKHKNFRERIENVNELINFSGTFKNLDEFLERISLLQSTDRPERSKSSGGKFVSLMTIHLAKGLEFDTVFLVGCSEGILPHQLSYGTLEELEEERRLMYVAMTRARKKLFLSFSKFPSRFLYEIPSALTVFSDMGNNYGELPDEDEVYLD